MLWGTTRLDLLDVRHVENGIETLRVRVPPGLPLNSTLVVRHARHVARAAPRDRPLVRAWRRRAQLYACAAGGNDDWYWLAAAVAAGDAGWLVSNDEMRDHHFGMLSRGDFLRWKARTVVKFEMDGGDVALAPPPPYSESAQFDAGGWHVPARVGAGAGEASAATVVVRRPAPGALAWLCCAPARAFEVSNKSE